MYDQIDCPDCTGAKCGACKGQGWILIGEPGIPLPWFLTKTPTTWAQMAGDLHTLAAEAEDQQRDLIVYDANASRTIPQMIEAGRARQDDRATRWIARRGAIYRITEAEWPAAVERFGEKLEGYEGKPVFRVEDVTVLADRMTDGVTPRAPRLAPVESTHIPGLFVERRGTLLTFKSGGYWETWDVRTGEQLGAADVGAFPSMVSAYIRERLADLLPPHRQAQREEAAPAPTETTSNNRTEAKAPAPIVGEPVPIVKHQEGPMAIDLSNPTVVTAARAVARNISSYLGIPALETRRTDLRQNHAAAEEAYQLAKAATEKVKREASAIDAALKERDQEMLLIFFEEKSEDGKKRYTADAAKASAVAARKTDEDYIALKTALGLAKNDLDTAEEDLARAKARQRAMAWEKDLLVAEIGLAAARVGLAAARVGLAAARVGAFAGLDGEAPAAAPTPIAA